MRNNIFVSAEDLYNQIKWKGLCTENQSSLQRLTNTLSVFLFDINVLDINDKTFYKDSTKLKLKKELRKDVAI